MSITRKFAVLGLLLFLGMSLFAAEVIQNISPKYNPTNATKIIIEWGEYKGATDISWTSSISIEGVEETNRVVVANLSPDMQYAFRVYLISDVGEGAYENQVAMSIGVVNFMVWCMEI